MNRSRKIAIIANLFAVDRRAIQVSIDEVAPLVDGFHVDFMDGALIPNFCADEKLLRDLNFHENPVEVHLMVESPEKIGPRLLAIPSVTAITVESKRQVLGVFLG